MSVFKHLPFKNSTTMYWALICAALWTLGMIYFDNKKKKK